MNKVNLIIFLILPLNFSCLENQNSATFEEGDFDIFIIDFWTGDESYFNKRMEFSKNGTEFYGELINPKYYVGKEPLHPERIKIDQKGLRLLFAFWNKADSFKDDCEEEYISSSIQNYTIIKNTDTIKVNKFCDWDKYQYDNLEKELFSDYFKLLNQNRVKLEDDLNRKLSGEWYPEKVKLTMKRGDTLILTKKSSNSTNQDCSWIFNKDYSFKNNCPNLLNINHSNQYGWDIDEGTVHFFIKDAFIEEESENEITYEHLNYGARFRVYTFSDNEIILTYLWD